jgi:DNA gyrase/topoisomerase IV subunit A
MGLKELIQHFIEHRKEVIVRRTRFLLKKAQQRAHILEGQIFAVCDIDEVVKLIRSSKTRDEAIGKLRERAFPHRTDHPAAAQIPQAADGSRRAKPVRSRRSRPRPSGDCSSFSWSAWNWKTGGRIQIGD